MKNLFLAIHKRIEALWYSPPSSGHPMTLLLWPFSKIFEGIVFFRRIYLKRFKQKDFSVPVIVIGNITVGGVGKTPLVIAVAKFLQAKGIRVGIISRGYKASTKHFPHLITTEDTAKEVGDEPLLMFHQTNCPIVIDPNRVEAAAYLIAKCNSQIIISDDGLQHYRLKRQIEVVVVDGERFFGNEYLLPAGPLREKISRLKQSDLIVITQNSKMSMPKAIEKLDTPKAFESLSNTTNKVIKQLSQDIKTHFIGLDVCTYRMHIVTESVCQLITKTAFSFETFKNKYKNITAVAGIGHPQRFFNTLESLGIAFKPYTFPDHHSFLERDFSFSYDAIIMTEKDAVKCYPFAQETWYYLPIKVELSRGFWDVLWKKLNIVL